MRQWLAWKNLREAECWATNIFLLVLLTFVFLDTVPTVGPLEVFRKIQTDIDIIMDKTGLWQGQWTLFGPAPLDRRIRISAVLFYRTTEGRSKTQTWNSPNWTSMPWYTKKRLFRMNEYIDDVQKQNNQATWQPLAEYLARTQTMNLTIDTTSLVDNTTIATVRTIYPYRVNLVRHAITIAAPSDSQLGRRPADHWLLGNKRPATMFPEMKSGFYQWEAPSNFSYAF